MVRAAMIVEAPYEAIVCDLDGCVWIGGKATPGAVEALERWRAGGGQVIFATNEPRHSPEAQVKRLWSLGIKASVDEIVTVGAAIQAHLADNHAGQTAFVIGTESLIRHVMAAGLRPTNNATIQLASRAQVVVVASHDNVSYAELRIAVQAIARGATLLGSGRDRTFPMPDGPWPGSGAILAAIEYATGATARTFGKPERDIYDLAMERIHGGRVLAIGDRLDSDIAGAAAAGLDSALVLTGTDDLEALAAWTGPRPRYVEPSLAQLLGHLDVPV